MLTFRDFKRSPGREICESLGLPINDCLSWSEFTEAAILYNGPGGVLVARARALNGVVGSGERVLLQAILHAADFDWLADEFANGRAWYRMDSTSNTYRCAVLACIARWDER